jgi:hypothetical protein
MWWQNFLLVQLLVHLPAKGHVDAFVVEGFRVAQIYYWPRRALQARHCSLSRLPVSLYLAFISSNPAGNVRALGYGQ